MSSHNRFSHMAALTSDSMALRQAPAETARPWTRGEYIARCACLPLLPLAIRLHCLVEEANVCERLAEGRTRQYSGCSIEGATSNRNYSKLATEPPHRTGNSRDINKQGCICLRFRGFEPLPKMSDAPY